MWSNCCICLSNRSSESLTSLEESLETAHNALDDVWKLDEFRYPQKRMENLMEIVGKVSHPGLCLFFLYLTLIIFHRIDLFVGNAVTQFIKVKMEDVNLWESPYNAVEEVLSQVLEAVYGVVFLKSPSRFSRLIIFMA